jgi:hypothetical protein
MPTYEVEVNGKPFEVEAPDEQGVMLAIKQIQSQPNTAPSQFAGGMAGSAALGAADTASFGFGDELGAALGSTSEKLASYITGDKPRSYDELLTKIRDQDKRAKEANPGSYLTGQVAGGVASAVGASGAGLSIAGRLAPNAGLLARVGAGAAEGALMGGTYGFGSGQGTTDRLEQGGLNAVIGGAAGGAIPVVAQGVSSGYRAIADRMAGGQAARAAGVSPEVSRMLADTLQADGSLGPQGLANMQRAGGEAMLADAGPNARSVLDTAIQRGGSGSVNARNAIDARVTRGSADINAALDGAFGAPQGVETARDAIRTGTAGARNSAYNAAYSSPIDYAAPEGQALEGLVRSRVPGNVIQDANRLMRLEGHESRQILARIADDGSVVYEQMPDVRQLDYITRALNQAAESGDGAGALGGQTPIGRAYQNLSREIRGNLRSAVPEYGNALDTAADPIRRSQAVEFGSKLLSPSVTRDQVAHEVAGHSAAERDALAQGIRSRIDDTLANVTRTVSDGNTEAREGIKALRDMSSRASRDKIVEAIGQQRAQPLFDELDRVATSFELRASVAENSKTYARQAVSGRINDITAPGPVGTALQGKPLNAVQKIAQILTGQTPERVSARQDAIYSEIADFLTRPAGQAVPAFQAMQNYGTQTAANQVRAAEIARLLSSARPAAYPIGGLSADKPRK